MASTSSVFRVAAFGGSLRKASCNNGLLRAAARLGSSASLEITHVSIADLPLFNSDLEADLPAPVAAFRESLSSSDGVLIACPEYNYSMSGVVKNAIDWASRSYDSDPSPLAGKPTAICGAGGGFGAGRAQYHLRQTCVFLDMPVMMKPELFVKIFESPIFDGEGNLTDEATTERLGKFLQSFHKWIGNFKAAKE
eukprot:CAMPEP_0197435134 /NCGR_PEP_ID=MMETSP1175-20131217/2770_1 /TAXON_ID=1003142 /ORGANISM="Triceratium dubium, Strain CCMP147" /LENGTH=194 /DNA_ID=CAMNT_0042964083 /DNA_START=30 /DNA_END=614 /DNA_ORIENTATION=-